MTYAIETNSLIKVFNKTARAVDGIDLRVPEGSIYGFLGPNGAGKTTTIKMLTGLSKPTSGSINILGKPLVFGKSNLQGSIGYLPDVPGFYNWMTASEFLILCGQLLGKDEVSLRRTVKDLMVMVGLDGVKKRVGAYSRGMKQRLGIAQALIGGPKVVFLDEPTSALDPIGRKEILDIIKKLAGTTTIFLSTHILNDVERICDRFAILDKGRIIRESAIDDISTLSKEHMVEMEIDCRGQIDAFIGALVTAGVTERADKITDTDIRFRVSNPETAFTAIPRLVADGGFALKRLESTGATLEEIFLEAVKK